MSCTHLFNMEYFVSSDESHRRGPEVSLLTSTDIELPKSSNAFHAFPGRHGWKVHHDYRLEARPSRTSVQDLASFLQSWLFFGLVSSIIQANGQPILRVFDLYNGEFLDTRKLTHAIQTWRDWETSNVESEHLRQANFAYILSTARHVVRRNSVLSSSRPHAVPDELELLLMVLGETLTTVTKELLKDTHHGRVVPYEGFDVDWGPPRWTFAQNEEGRRVRA